MSFDENRSSKCRKRDRIFGICLIVLAYACLAAGVTLACLAQIPLIWRVISPAAGLAGYALCGTFGYSLACEYAFSFNSPQRKREWASASFWSRLGYVVTYPCELICKVISFFDP